METINKMKRQPTEWEKIFANHVYNNYLISKLYKNSYNSIAKKKKQSDFKMGRIFKETFFQRHTNA